jgi:hypothetical protein
LNFSSAAKPDIQLITANRNQAGTTDSLPGLLISPNFLRAGNVLPRPKKLVRAVCSSLDIALMGVVHAVGSKVLATPFPASIDRFLGCASTAGRA